MSVTDNRFSDCVQLLLQGHVICESGHEILFHYLQDTARFQRVDDHLRAIQRTLRHTSDQKAYVCAYADSDDPVVQREIRRQFSELVNELEPLVRWLTLCMRISRDGMPLQPGERIKESDFLAAIEESPSLTEDLERLARSGFVRSTGQNGSAQLKTVMLRLVEKGYFKDASVRSGSVYQATGKWSWLYDQMEFIYQHELLDKEAETVEQAEIF